MLIDNKNNYTSYDNKILKASVGAIILQRRDYTRGTASLDLKIEHFRWNFYYSGIFQTV
jgi:hypothetical protein